MIRVFLFNINHGICSSYYHDLNHLLLTFRCLIMISTCMYFYTTTVKAHYYNIKIDIDFCYKGRLPKTLKSAHGLI